MGSSTNIGYGFIHRKGYDYSLVEKHVTNNEHTSIQSTKYKGLSLIHDNMNDKGQFVFGNLTILDSYCYNEFETFTGPIPNELYLKKLREDFALFLKNEDIPDDLKDPDDWIEGYYIQLND